MKHIKSAFFAILFGLVCSVQFADANPIIHVGEVSPMLSQVCSDKPDTKACVLDVVTALKFAKQVGRTEAYCEVYMSQAKIVHTDKNDQYCQDFQTNKDVLDLYNWIGAPNEVTVK